LTKEILVQYADIEQEVKELQLDIQKLEHELKRLDNEPESDCVKSSAKEFPYVCHTVMIRGINFTQKGKVYATLEKKLKMQQSKCDELLEVFTEAEEFIELVDNSRMRRILRYRYIDKLSWVQVAVRMGGNTTDESVRKEHDRFFQSL
jgi:predicted RNase H-like nuclease (RuvC/YqgF family)